LHPREPRHPKVCHDHVRRMLERELGTSDPVSGLLDLITLIAKA
jgi:hypothetical protein